MCMISSYLVDSIHVGRIDPVKDRRLFGRKIMHPVFFSKKKSIVSHHLKKQLKKGYTLRRMVRVFVSFEYHIYVSECEFVQIMLSNLPMS